MFLDAEYYKTKTAASASAESSALITEQEAKNIIKLAEARKTEIELQGLAYSSVPAGHAQAIQQALIDVQRRKAMPPNTVWFENTTDNGVTEGFKFAKGMSVAK